jgi:cell division septum initiation protein DivIVA
MKFNLKTLGVLGLVVAIVAAGVLYQMRNTAISSQKASEDALVIENLRRVGFQNQNRDLTEQIAVAQEEVAQAEIRLTVLGENVVVAENELDKAKAQYPTLIESIEYSETLLGMASAAGVLLQTISTSDAGIADFSEKLFLFYGTNFSLSVVGEVENILAFVDLITKSSDFQSGRIGNVNMSMPLPVPPLVVTQEEQDAIADRIWAEMLVEKRAEKSSFSMVVLTGQAVLKVLGAGPNIVTMETITERIRVAVAAKFGALIANQFAPELAEAVEQAVAERLVGIISDIYSQSIGDLFTAGEPQLTPEYGGILGPEITEALRGIPPSMIPETVRGLIERNINEVLAGYIEDMVSTEEHAARVAAEVAEILAGAETTPPAEAEVTLTLFTFGDN